MDGNWENRVTGRKTAVCPFKHPSDFSKHFNQTKCIFCDDEGFCLLQKIATRENKDPWEYKPCACCLFPLVVKQGQLTPPPNKGDKDDCYVDENYPGYATSLYCGQDCPEGEEWQKVLQQKVDYFHKNFSK